MANNNTPVKVTKTGVSVETNYCRRCMKDLPAKEFYECTDAGFIDKNGLMSVCKGCIQDMYDEIYAEKQSFEKAIHKLCTSLNIKYSNDAVSATKAHINTLLEGGKQVNAIFGIFKQKLTATKASMDKSGLEDMTYEDVGTIFTTQDINTKETPIPQDILDFWGHDFTRPQIEILEREYTNFKQTYKSKTYAEIVLLKQVCYTILDIEEARRQGDDTDDLLKQLQALMKSLTISPEAASKLSTGKEVESYGLWIQDIEQFEPCQWLLSDPRGDIYRDVADTEGYFQKFIVRPLKNFILGSKDFNVEDIEQAENELSIDSDEDFGLYLEDDESEV